MRKLAALTLLAALGACQAIPPDQHDIQHCVAKTGADQFIIDWDARDTAITLMPDASYSIVQFYDRLDGSMRKMVDLVIERQYRCRGL